jgi:sterol desaturase/sphingolipid hydroxylase (fatty acid hydroxylase superfamily)
MIIGDVIGVSMTVVITSLYMGFSPIQNIVWCGFVSGYALYIVYHDSAHRDRSNGIADINGRYFHVLHHAADKNRNYTTNFGVTTITWDWVFGTIDKKMTFSLNGIVPAVIPLCAPFSFRYFLVREERKEFSKCEELELSY